MNAESFVKVFFNELTAEYIEDVGGHGPFLLLLYLRSICDWSNGKIGLYSDPAAAAQLGLSVNTVRHQRRRLEECGAIEVTQHRYGLRVTLVDVRFTPFGALNDAADAESADESQTGNESGKNYRSENETGNQTGNETGNQGGNQTGNQPYRQLPPLHLSRDRKSETESSSDALASLRANDDEPPKPSKRVTLSLVEEFMRVSGVRTSDPDFLSRFNAYHTQQ